MVECLVKYHPPFSEGCGCSTTGDGATQAGGWGQYQIWHGYGYESCCMFSRDYDFSFPSFMDTTASRNVHVHVSVSNESAHTHTTQLVSWIAHNHWQRLATLANAHCSANMYQLFSDLYCLLGVASYPGLLTPAFVACSTNVGEGLVKLSHVQWYVEEWHIPGKTASDDATNSKHGP